MDLAKLFVAIGIAFLLSLLVSSALSVFYKAPTVDYADCYTSENVFKCIEEQSGGLETHQLVNQLIIGFLSVLAIAIGFLLIDKVSIGSGVIGAGVLGLLFGSLVSSLSTMLFAFSSISSLAGGAASLSTLQKAMPYINLTFLLIGTIALISFAYFKLEKKSKQK